MSQLIRTTSEKEVASTATAQRSAIIKNRFNSQFQWSEGVSFNPPSILPGSSSRVDVNLKSTDLEREEAHYIRMVVANSHGTAAITLPFGVFSVLEYMKIQVNNGSQTFTVDNVDTWREMYNEWLMNCGLFIYEDSSFVRNETTTSAGITIAALSSATFYLPLDLVLTFAGTCIQGEINSIGIDIRATAEQSNVANTGYLFKSATDVNVWGRTYITISDINYIRSFTKLNSGQQLVKSLGSMNASVPVRFVHWKVHPIILKEGTANSGDTVVKKLSDIYKSDLIQHISFTIRKTQTAYNGADCAKEFSGFNYIGWKWRELNKGGQAKTLDLTDKRKLRDFEFKQYRNEFGRKQLPLVHLADSTDTFAQYLLRLTRINFDYLQVEQSHEVIRYTNSNSEDYEITLVANATVGSSCQWMAYVVVAEVYEFNRKDGTLTLIPS